MPGNIVLCPSKIRLFTTKYDTSIYVYFPKRTTKDTSVLLTFRHGTWRVYDRNWFNHDNIDSNLKAGRWINVAEDRVPALKHEARVFARKMIAQGKLP